MPRDLSPSVLAAIAAGTVTLAYFVELQFADNTYYVWTGMGQITPAGPAYSSTATFPYGVAFTGVGWLGKLSAIPQTSKVQAQNVTVGLSGIPVALVSEVAEQVRITGIITIWMAFFDQATGTVLQDPSQVFYGSMDEPSMSDEAATSTAEISCENTLLSLNQPPNRRFDDPDQQLLYPGDLGFSFVQPLQNIQLFWPQSATSGSPYPDYMTVNPSAPDVAVGSTVSVTVTIHYSDGSTYTQPGASGGGPSFKLNFASSDPTIATITYAFPLLVTGVKPGACNLMARVPGPSGSGYGTSIWRQIGTIFVHN